MSRTHTYVTSSHVCHELSYVCTSPWTGGGRSRWLSRCMSLSFAVISRSNRRYVSRTHVMRVTNSYHIYVTNSCYMFHKLIRCMSLIVCSNPSLKQTTVCVTNSCHMCHELVCHELMSYICHELISYVSRTHKVYESIIRRDFSLKQTVCVTNSCYMCHVSCVTLSCHIYVTNSCHMFHKLIRCMSPSFAGMSRSNRRYMSRTHVICVTNTSHNMSRTHII